MPDGTLERQRRRTGDHRDTHPSSASSVGIADQPIPSQVWAIGEPEDHSPTLLLPTAESPVLGGPFVDDRDAEVPELEPTSAPAARRFPRWCQRYVTTLLAADVLVGAAAGTLAGVFGAATALTVVALGCAGALFWASAISVAHGYDRARIGVGSDEMRAVMRAGVGGLATIALVTAVLQSGFQRPLIVVVPGAVLASTAARFCLRKLLHRRRGDGRGVRRVVLVGDPESVGALARRFESERHFGMKPVAAVVPAGAEAAALRECGMPVSHGLWRVESAVQEVAADAVAVAPGTEPGFLRKLGWALEGSRVELLVDPGLMEIAGPRLHVRHFEGLPLLHVEEPRFSGGTRVIKAVTDRALAALLLVAALPLWVGVALAIKLEDRGPVFFRQERVGKDGKHFSMWKFRSMHTDAERRLAELEDRNEGAGVMFKMRDDPRVTRVGAVIRKYSIDELPQLINVLIGTMSLVGPRPPLPREVAVYERPEHRRLLVAPGLTGLWQISGRSDLSWEESIRLDLRYVENWTFTGDLLILWKTLFAVLARRGAY